MEPSAGDEDRGLHGAFRTVGVDKRRPTRAPGSVEGISPSTECLLPEQTGYSPEFAARRIAGAGQSRWFGRRKTAPATEFAADARLPVRVATASAFKRLTVVWLATLRLEAGRHPRCVEHSPHKQRSYGASFSAFPSAVFKILPRG